ncbi:HI0074 family nucleotidyltransferase substrate-binding subunit [Desulfurobacterium crinifex]
MEKFKRALSKFEKAFGKFEEAVRFPDSFNLSHELLVEITTKRFEYTFESMWKAVKEFLRTQGLECNSPRSCFRELLKEGIVSMEFEEVLFDMIMLRNLLVHVYDEEQAKKIYREIVKEEFLNTFKTILQELRKE